MEQRLSNSTHYQRHLDKVSRSFSFCISNLDQPFRDWVGLSYLLLRILDTIEDSDWESKESQFQAFDWFLKSFEHSVDHDDWHRWSGIFSDSVKPAELSLIKFGGHLVSDWQEMPENPKSQILQTIKKMSFGMQKFITKQPSQDAEKIRLMDMSQVQEYCIFVAGIVGELLLYFHDTKRGIQSDRKDFVAAKKFGTCLQKVNILKDQDEDEAEGRYFVPSRQDVFKSFKDDLEPAFYFSAEVLKEDSSLSRFCLWSLFLAVSTLEQGTNNEILVHKVESEELSNLLYEVDKNLNDQVVLKEKWNLRCRLATDA